MQNTRLFNLVLLLGISLVMTGCSSFGPLSKQQIPSSPVLSANAEAYMVQMLLPSGDTASYKGEIQSGGNNPTTIQDALESSGALKKFKNMQITIYRQVQESGRSLKMPIQFEPGNNAVAIEQDYALHHGDRIMIEPTSSGPFDRILDALTGSNL